MLATANTGKTRERFWKKIQVNGPEGLKLARKNSLAVSVACMATYWPTPGFKERTFKLCVLTRYDFNFCIRSSQLRGSDKGNHSCCCTTTWKSREGGGAGISCYVHPDRKIVENSRFVLSMLNRFITAVSPFFECSRSQTTMNFKILILLCLAVVSIMIIAIRFNCNKSISQDFEPNHF